MFQFFRSWIQKFRPEDPRRIQAFRKKLEGLQWDQQNLDGSIQALFEAVDDLAEAEVRYYYRRRGTRALISGVTRFFAWLLGSVGLLLPLVAATSAPMFAGWGQYGYAFLAAAACCLGANSLFGGTQGHIRFVSTQLELEKLIAASRIGWCEYLATKKPNNNHQKGFELIFAYTQALHLVTISETSRWGETLLAELAKFRNTLKSSNIKKDKDQPGT
jgi:hypothetical protein